ncbi:hypothetical protein BDV18DRAFT_155288 [Aspergillus unguis]
MLARPRITRLAVLILTVLAVLWLTLAPDSPPASVPAFPQDHARNRTLGFSQILALSSRPSWRTRGLQAAANLTGLEITIPPQPPLDDRLAEAFASIGSDLFGITRPAFGASKAWLAHLDLIKYIYQSKLESALVLEDDADWDVEIKAQMGNISSAVRNLTKIDEGEPAPYGLSWDVLWLGHCGEQWDEWTDTVIFNDTNVLPHHQYIGFWADSLAQLPDGKRAVYSSTMPVCTFAYAVSYAGAYKILSHMSAGMGEAFDVQMQNLCQRRIFNCVSVVPEVFHQYFPPLELGVKSDVDIGNGESMGKIEAAETVMGSTENILHSARCWALWGVDCQRVPEPVPELDL